MVSLGLRGVQDLMKEKKGKIKKRVITAVILVAAVFALFVPVFSAYFRDGGSKASYPLIPLIYYMDYHEIAPMRSHNMKEIPYAEQVELPSYVGGRGVGLFFGMVEIIFEKYDVYPDGYKGKTKGFTVDTHSGEYTGINENEVLLRDVLKVCDTKDRETLAKKFSIEARQAAGFEQELDAFIKAYPGNMADIKLLDWRESLEPDHGRRLDGGVYVREKYRSFAGYCNDKWYYVFISQSYYCAAGEEHTGINKILILDAASRAEFNSSGAVKTFGHLLCDVGQNDTEYRIILNDAYKWSSNPNTPLTSEKMLSVLKTCYGYEDLIKDLGTPNALYKEGDSVTCYYEAVPSKKPLYFCVTIMKYSWEDLPSVVCTICDSEKEEREYLYNSNRDRKGTASFDYAITEPNGKEYPAGTVFKVDGFNSWGTMTILTEDGERVHSECYNRYV